MSDTFPTAAEQAAANAKAASDRAKNATSPAKVPVPNASTFYPDGRVDGRAVADAKAAEDKAKAAEDELKARPGPFNLTTDDKFTLKDANSDGVFDTIVIERVDRVAVAKAKAERERYADFYGTVTAARHAATVANSGRPASDVAEAEDLAEATVRAGWKGPFPPADAVKAAAKAVDAREQAAIAAELAKLKN